MTRHFTVLPLALLVLSAASAADRPKDGPNVLFVMADDLNTHLGCYGEVPPPTPNLDRLAAESVQFEHAYCQYPSCGPSRASLMTGRRPNATKVYINETDFRDALPDVVTLPQLFRENGYHTARVGKIFHMGVPGDIGTSGRDDEVSWDEVRNPIGVDRLYVDQIVQYEPAGGMKRATGWADLPDDSGRHTDQLVTEQAIDLMRDHRSEPFFLAVGYFRPHFPFVAPHSCFEKVRFDRVLLPVEPAGHLKQILPAARMYPPHYGLAEEQVRRIKRAYLASIAFVDAEIGKLLEGLKEADPTRETIVILTSDHGFNLGEHGHWQKGSLWEESLRVPLLIRRPNEPSAGAVCRATVELVDLYPTVAELAGLPTRSPMDGESLVPLLDDPQQDWPHPAYSMLQPVNKGRIGYSVRSGDWHYIQWQGEQPGGQLFRHSGDPHEWNNLAESPEYAAEVEQMQQLLKREQRAVPPDEEALRRQATFPPDVPGWREDWLAYKAQQKKAHQAYLRRARQEPAANR